MYLHTCQKIFEYLVVANANAKSFEPCEHFVDAVQIHCISVYITVSPL